MRKARGKNLDENDKLKERRARGNIQVAKNKRQEVTDKITKEARDQRQEKRQRTIDTRRDTRGKMERNKARRKIQGARGEMRKT